MSFLTIEDLERQKKMTERQTIRPAENLLHAKTLAIVGASPKGNWPNLLFHNLKRAEFPGNVYLINPNYKELWDAPCYPNLQALPEAVEHLLMLVPTRAVIPTLEEAAPLGTKAATIYSSGFGEGTDPRSHERGKALADFCEESGMVCCGPNCMGTASVNQRMMTYAQRQPLLKPGPVGAVFQSGGSLGNWMKGAAERGIGFSYAISSGNEVNLDVVDYMSFLIDDPNTYERVIEYLEGTEADLTSRVKMYEDADSEIDLHRVSSLHLLNQGLTIRKIVWDRFDDRLTCPVISPLTFVVDPGCTQVSLADARFCGQRDAQSKLDVSVNYPSYEMVGNPEDIVTVDEMWVRGWVAKHYLGIDTELDIIRLVFVDGELLDAWPSPWNYPDFPYSAWRCFDVVDKSKKPCQFWGTGYPKKLWRQQKLLDNIIANILIMISNQASGMMITEYGAFTNPSILKRIHGAIIELAKGKTLRQVQELPPVQISREAVDLMRFVVEIMEGITGIGAVFTGEAPDQALSGRAISSLQAQAFSHISNLIRGMVEHRRRLARMKASAVQQYAQRPVKPNLWRGGIDIKSEFPEDARHVGYQEEIHDTSLLPQTAAGKMEFAQLLSQFGLTIEKFLELTGIDKAYGLSPKDFAVASPNPVAAGGANQPNEDVLAGVERQAA